LKIPDQGRARVSPTEMVWPG